MCWSVDGARVNHRQSSMQHSAHTSRSRLNASVHEGVSETGDDGGTVAGRAAAGGAVVEVAAVAAEVDAVVAAAAAAAAAGEGAARDVDDDG